MTHTFGDDITDGFLHLTPALNADQIAYLHEFARQPRRKRFIDVIEHEPDSLREAVGMPLGGDGAFYTGKDVGYIRGGIFMTPAGGVRDLYCPWKPSMDGTTLVRNDAVTHCINWLEDMNKTFFQRWGIALNAELKFSYALYNDKGVFQARNGCIDVLRHERFEEYERQRLAQEEHAHIMNHMPDKVGSTKSKM